MSLEPGRQVVWIGDLFIDERAPMALCPTHVARVTVPAGWAVNDLRDDAPAFWRELEAVETEPAATCTSTSGARPSRRWSATKMQTLPGLFETAPDVDDAEVAPIPVAAPIPTVAAQLASPATVEDQVRLQPVAEAPRQTLDGLGAMYGPSVPAEMTDDGTSDEAAADNAADVAHHEDELIDALLAAETPLLARAFRNARAS